jgi:hypothetical protein
MKTLFSEESGRKNKSVMGTQASPLQKRKGSKYEIDMHAL